MVSPQLPGIHNEDILPSIFSFLPILDLARCAAVCRQWHEVVMGSTKIWKGKRYTSKRGSRISDEMRAVLFALPKLYKVEVELSCLCYGNFSYPCLSLAVRGISDLQAVKDWQMVRCTHLSIELNFADFFFSSHSPIDFSVLQKLNITVLNGAFTVIKQCTRAESVIRCALQLCLNLRELSIHVDALSADYLDTLEGLSQLRTLKIHCKHLEKLVFLRHCSEVLEELELEGCIYVPSAEFAELRCLKNLRKLRLHDCGIEEGDLEVAALGLRSLVSLHLSMCDISDLSFLRHCGQLQEVSVVVGNQWQKGSTPTGLWNLPASVRSLCLTYSAATAEELWEVLPRLPSLDQLSLSCEKLDRLDFLRDFPQLRRLCLDYSSCPDKSQLLNLCHLSQLETLDLPGHSDDLAFLSSVIPSLPQLNTLSVGYGSVVDYILRDYPRLRSLTLCDKDGKQCDMSKLGRSGYSIFPSKYVCKFVCEVV